jgi:LacI family transcriptional regulator
VPSPTWPWMGDVLQGASDVVESGSYGLMLFTCNRGDESMRQFATQVSAQSFDGLLVIEPEGTLDYIEELHNQGLPVVLIDDRAHRPRFPSVATTNRLGGESAARHLLDLGRTRPLVVTGAERFGCTEDRLSGFTAVYRDAGIPLPRGHVVEGDFTFGCGRAAIQGALSAGARFDAVFAHNDLSAAGALLALREAGLGVPDDVAVVGFDDLPVTMQTDPPLTTVHQPLREMGAAAAGMLMSHFEGAPLPHTPNIIPTTLVVRASTKAGT